MKVFFEATFIIIFMLPHHFNLTLATISTRLALLAEKVAQIQGTSLTYLIEEEFDSDRDYGSALYLRDLSVWLRQGRPYFPREEDEQRFTFVLEKVENLKVFEALLAARKHTWIIHDQDGKASEELYLYKNYIGLESNVLLARFIGEIVELSEIYFILDRTERNILCRIITAAAADGEERREDYNLEPSCRLRDRISERRDMKGLTLNVVLAFYFPWSGKGQSASGGEYDGIFPEMMYAVARNLNLTLNITLGGAWGSLDENGTLTGMTGDVFRGVYDMMFTGATVTFDRKDRLDFIGEGIYFNERNVVVQSPTGQKVGMNGYTEEFSIQLWSTIVITVVVNFSILILVSNKVTAKERILNAGEIVLRTILAKPYHDRHSQRRFSIYISHLTVFACAMVLWIAYRAIMNAFLAVQIDVMEIESYQDLLDYDYKLIIYHDGADEDFFKKAPEGTARSRIYQEKLSGDSYSADLDLSQVDLEEAAGLVASEGQIAMFTTLSPVKLIKKYYPCYITEARNPDMKSLLNVGYPIYKVRKYVYGPNRMLSFFKWKYFRITP